MLLRHNAAIGTGWNLVFGIISLYNKWVYVPSEHLHLQLNFSLLIILQAFLCLTRMNKKHVYKLLMIQQLVWKTSDYMLCFSFSSSNINYETITAIISTVLPLTTIIFLLLGEYFPKEKSFYLLFRYAIQHWIKQDWISNSYDR